MGKFCLIICAIAMAFSESMRILDLREKVNGLDDGSAKGEERRNTVSDTFCCCREGHCLDNEIDDGSHAKWEGRAPLCCRFAEHACSAHPNEYCESPQEMEIENIIKKASEQCRPQLNAFVEQIQIQLELHKELFFHGTAIKAIHMRKAVTEIVHRLIMPGQDKFDPSSIGAHFFRHNERITLLWNRIEADDRKRWKSKLSAAEMSRGDDVPFARVVDHADVGQLRNCTNLNHLWYVASATFASVAPEKPLVLLIGKNNQRELKDTQFWKGELQGVAENPPHNGLEVVSLGKFQCDDLMNMLGHGLADRIPPGTKGNAINSGWSRIASFTCRQADVKSPDTRVGRTFHPPLYGTFIRPGFPCSIRQRFGEERLDLFFQKNSIENLRATVAAIMARFHDGVSLFENLLLNIGTAAVTGASLFTRPTSPHERQKRICERIGETTLPKETTDGDIESLILACQEPTGAIQKTVQLLKTIQRTQFLKTIQLKDIPEMHSLDVFRKFPDVRLIFQSD